MVEVLLSGIVLGLVPVTITGLICSCLFTIPTWKPIWSLNCKEKVVLKLVKLTFKNDYLRILITTLNYKLNNFQINH